MARQRPTSPRTLSRLSASRRHRGGEVARRHRAGDTAAPARRLEATAAPPPPSAWSRLRRRGACRSSSQRWQRYANWTPNGVEMTIASCCGRRSRVKPSGFDVHWTVWQHADRKLRPTDLTLLTVDRNFVRRTGLPARPRSSLAPPRGRAGAQSGRDGGTVRTRATEKQLPTRLLARLRRIASRLERIPRIRMNWWAILGLNQ